MAERFDGLTKDPFGDQGRQAQASQSQRMVQQQVFGANSFENGGVPQPVVPPRGLSGVLDGYDATEILDTSQFPPNMVLLNVYDIARDVELFQKINKVTTGNNNALIGGLFHAGVEVYGIEWCYGFADDGRSGVSHVMPRSHPQHNYRTTVPMGVTAFGAREVRVLMGRMTEEWPGWEYHLFHHNCLNFSNALCAELGVGRIPGWVDRAPRAASALDTGYRGLRSTVQDIDVSVRSAIPTDAEDAQFKALEALDGVQRRSVIAVEVAQTQAQVLAEAAQVQAQELHAKALPAVEQTRTFVRAKTADLGEFGRDLLGEEQANKAQEHAAAIGEKAQEIGGKAQEHAQALGASLWSGFRDLHRAASEIGTPANAAQDERSSSQDWGFGSFLSQAAATVDEAANGQRSFGREAAPPEQDVGTHDECESLLDMPGVEWHEEAPAAAKRAPAAQPSAPAAQAPVAQAAPAPERDPLDDCDDMFFGAGEPSAPAAPVASSTGCPGADLLGAPKTTGSVAVEEQE